MVTEEETDGQGTLKEHVHSTGQTGIWPGHTKTQAQRWNARPIM